MSRSINRSAATAARSPSCTGVAVGLVALLIMLALGYRWWSGPADVPGTALATNDNVFVLAVPAFLAGLLSFVSPCTLPILPTYFAFTFHTERERMVQMTIAFFMGLATTMIVLGATASVLSQAVFEHRRLLSLVGGLVIVGFGIMSLLGKGFGGVMIQRRPTASVAGSYAYGATFALGWTSCVGPILGALLTMLATQGGTVLQGALLSFIYALGLGTPLILGARYVSQHGTNGPVWRAIRGRSITFRLKQRSLELHSTSILSGALLIMTGLMLASGQLATWSQWAVQTPISDWLLGVEDGIRRLFLGG